MLFSRKASNRRIRSRRLAAHERYLPHGGTVSRRGTGADDVVQDVYLQAWKSFGQFESGPIAVLGYSRFCFTLSTITAGNG